METYKLMGLATDALRTWLWKIVARGLERWSIWPTLGCLANTSYSKSRGRRPFHRFSAYLRCYLSSFRSAFTAFKCLKLVWMSFYQIAPIITKPEEDVLPEFCWYWFVCLINGFKILCSSVPVLTRLLIGMESHGESQVPLSNLVLGCLLPELQDLIRARLGLHYLNMIRQSYKDSIM